LVPNVIIDGKDDEQEERDEETGAGDEQMTSDEDELVLPVKQPSDTSEHGQCQL